MTDLLISRRIYDEMLKRFRPTFPNQYYFGNRTSSKTFQCPPRMYMYTRLCVFAHARVCEYVELREYSPTAHFEKMKGRYLHAYNRSQASMQPSGQLFF